MADAPHRVLWPNIGAEEGDATRFANQPAVQATRRLWSELFEGPAAFEVLDEAEGFVPWLADADAAREATRIELPLFPAPPEVVAHVHDKAFAVRLACDEGLEPEPLAACVRVFDAGEVARADAFAQAVQAACQAWPDAFKKGGFTLKPRFGTSGRGRVGGSVHGFDAEPVRRAAARFARQGGAILEPWLSRTTDLSAVAWISPRALGATSPPITLLASFEQLVSEAGVWLGHMGEIDRGGRIFSGTRFDDDMREAAAAAAGAAQIAGHIGPCGIDGFAYLDAQADAQEGVTIRLRPLIELNARFTLGHVCAGWLRRVHADVVAQYALAPGRRLAFLFALAPPAHHPGWAEFEREAGAYRVALPAAATASGVGPFLLFHEDAARLRTIAERITRRAAPSDSPR